MPPALKLASVGAFSLLAAVSLSAAASKWMLLVWASPALNLISAESLTLSTNLLQMNSRKLVRCFVSARLCSLTVRTWLDRETSLLSLLTSMVKFVWTRKVLTLSLRPPIKSTSFVRPPLPMKISSLQSQGSSLLPQQASQWSHPWANNFRMREMPDANSSKNCVPSRPCLRRSLRSLKKRASEAI